jgi:hypothetical protein
MIVSSLLEDEETDIDHERLQNLIDIYIRNKIEIGRSRSKVAKLRKKKKRLCWSTFQASLTDTQFRRMYRMNRRTFLNLCNVIESNVGVDEFKSERYLESLETQNSMIGSISRAHGATSSGFVSGEIKVAITLRILAGGSYLDLFVIYNIFQTHAYKIFHDTLKNWICNDEIFSINGEQYLNDLEAMKEVAKGFEQNCRCGVFRGCIGAVDGWLVKISQPCRKDGVTQPGDFFSRKGFFAINVQVIVDRFKRVLYKSILCRGAEHDSSAFKASDIHPVLMEKRELLEREGLYFIGDSAYALRSFLVTPYDNAVHGDGEDNFNFYHSSSRIVVECTFGEVDMRWGIFWKPLKFSLEKNALIIDASLRLHNFIVNSRMQTLLHNDDVEARSDIDIHRQDIATHRVQNPMGAHGIYGGEQEVRFNTQRGRPLQQEVEANMKGKEIRDNIKREISTGNWVRPATNWYRDNNRTVMQ